MTEKNLNPKTKKRNRIVALVLIIVILFVVAMTFKGMYHVDIDKEQLKHYRENTETSND